MSVPHPTPPPKVVHASGQEVPEHLSTTRPGATREERIDQQMEDSFPASDPPSYSGGNHIVGAPVARESDAPSGEAPEVKEAEKKVHDGGAKKPGTY
ncbi:MAG TPA: hypothetical protein VNW15_15985 [Rhizomicrobium sp.]|jgi:hypothetical protein|nr:hypothetical protein [Rhizomicrobium sp.]